MVTIPYLLRRLFMPLLALALLVPAAAHAAGKMSNFQATFIIQNQLTQCSPDPNTYCISDQGTGRVNPLGPSTFSANETESLLDPTSPCGYQVQATATITGTGDATLSLSLALNTCVFGTDEGATIVKAGSFTITGGTRGFVGASGSGIVYKIGTFSSPVGIFAFQGTISGGDELTGGGDQGAPQFLGGATCALHEVHIDCQVGTTNTVGSYTAAQCGSTAITGSYVQTDDYALTFNSQGQAVAWRDMQAAPGSLSTATSGTTLAFRLAQTLSLQFQSPGNFETASTQFAGPGLRCSAPHVQPVRPAQITYDSSGHIVVNAPPTLPQICAALL